MRVCGIEIKGSDSVLVVLEGEAKDFQTIDCDIRKISIENTENSYDIKNFHKNFKKFVIDENIDIVGVKKRNTKGRFAGGALSFKMEALIQLLDVKIVLLPSATIAKSIKKKNPDYPEDLKKYQHGAFETGFALLQT
ncbi:MAG: DUF3010 family protein [Desulfobacterales bacterium]|nr:DUF3010 family protein [Desulfobacterales bacterium]